MRRCRWSFLAGLSVRGRGVECLPGQQRGAEAARLIAELGLDQFRCAEDVELDGQLFSQRGQQEFSSAGHATTNNYCLRRNDPACPRDRGRKAVDGIGWQEMCRSENLDVIRGQFRMAYTALLERSITEVAASEGAALLPQILRPQIGMH